MGLKNKSVKRSSINMQNSFDDLANDVVEEGAKEWAQMKSKIDLDCNLGMKIAEGEMKRWSKDLRKYYNNILLA
nr:zinc knuckle CX2CX4HX4C [Tanacetum cinerariifolium]